MSDASVLFVKPQSISDADKRRLSRNGIVVVEIDDPAAVKFVQAERAWSELPQSTIINCAAQAIAHYQPCITKFGEAICHALARQKEPS